MTLLRQGSEAVFHLAKSVLSDGSEVFDVLVSGTDGEVLICVAVDWRHGFEITDSLAAVRAAFLNSGSDQETRALGRALDDALVAHRKEWRS